MLLTYFKLLANEKIYKQYSIEYPFEFRFIDEVFNKGFVNEQLLGKLSVLFAALAIFICCLGLFGLVVSAIERCSKEFCFWKVLGNFLTKPVAPDFKRFFMVGGHCVSQY